MKEQFLPYNLALKLKELGFNEECLAYYNGLNLWLSDKPSNFSNRRIGVSNSVHLSSWMNAPLWQQAARFLSISSNNQINISIDGEDNYENLSKKLEQAIKDFRDL